jgi:beta-lactam-binding protein with PASTA domain
VVTVNADTAVTATFTKEAPPPPPPAEEKCVVPKLKGLTLGKAKSALTKAHCKAGKVSKPKKAKGALVVKSSKPAAGTVLPAGSKVDLKLAPKPQKKGKK